MAPLLGPRRFRAGRIGLVAAEFAAGASVSAELQQTAGRMGHRRLPLTVMARTSRAMTEWERLASLDKPLISWSFPRRVRPVWLVRAICRGTRLQPSHTRLGMRAVYLLLSRMFHHRRAMGGWVYMMTNKPFGTHYVGVTNDIVRRAWEHRQGTGSRFSAHYHYHYKLTRLVYVERHEEILAAIHRETRLKHWPWLWKLNLIERENPLGKIFSNG